MLTASDPIALAGLGLIIGMRHATDPDHVVAVTAILTREHRLTGAARVGLVWGLGHSATVLAVGAAIILFKLKVPHRLGLGMEFAVAVVLILLGLGTVTRTIAAITRRVLRLAPIQPRVVVHSHRHSHEGGGWHSHPHVHQLADASVSTGDRSHAHLAPAANDSVVGRSLAKSFLVGLVHGLAGSAAIALLVLAAIPTALGAILYMIVFCVGVMLGMVIITSAIGAPFIIAARRMQNLHHRLTAGAAWLSFGFGVFLVCQIAFD